MVLKLVRVCILVKVLETPASFLTVIEKVIEPVLADRALIFANLLIFEETVLALPTVTLEPLAETLKVEFPLVP